TAHFRTCRRLLRCRDTISRSRNAVTTPVNPSGNQPSRRTTACRVTNAEQSCTIRRTVWCREESAMKTTCCKYILAAAVATISVPVLGNGFALNEQSASTAGTNYAGRASNPIDATTIYGNPAGMSRLDHAQISAGAGFIHAKSDIDNAQGLFPGTNDGDMVPSELVPFAYYAHPLSDEWSAVLGFYVPFGVETNYESSFQGRFHGLKSRVQVLSLQPTISYTIADGVSIGGGPVISRLDGELSNAIPGGVLAQNPGVPPQIIPGLVNGPDTRVKMKGHDEAFGFNLGLLVALNDNLDWGITYHSKLKFKLDGHIDISNSPPASMVLANGRYNANLTIIMPESVDTSLTYHLNQWTLSAGATWTRWSRLQG